MLDAKTCEEAMIRRDPSFDGLFFVGVRTTGIYCRPVCKVRMPRRENVTFHPSAAAAERAGYRPCLRCRPETAPFCPAWKGVIPMSGADWSRIRSDGNGALDVRMCLRTDDGAILCVHWYGLMVVNEANRGYALDFAKPDDPAGADRYYFRTCPQIETGDARYAWLNTVVCVTKSRTGDGGVIHRIFAVK